TILSGDIDQDDGVHPDDGNAYHVVYFYNVGDQTRLDGFRIMRGYAGSGLYFSTFGGGIRNTSNGPGRQSCPTIANCRIEGNRATNFGGGVYNYSTADGVSRPVFINCVFSGNRSDKNGGAIYSYGINGGQSSPRLINCSFASNRAGMLGGGIYHYENGTPSLTNCILWGNQADSASAAFEHEVVDNGNDTILYSHCNIRGSDAWPVPAGLADQVLDTDPLYVAPPFIQWAPLTGGDLRLKEGSPCIDSGINDSVWVAYDLNKAERIQNEVVEMGAYEGFEPMKRIYVKRSATGLNNGSSWENAFVDLQSALDKATIDDEIWVAYGIYRPSKEFDLDESGGSDPREKTFLIPDGVNVYGGFGGNETARHQRDPKIHETTLSGDVGNHFVTSDNVYHVVCFVNAGERTVFDGFTITAGNADCYYSDVHTQGGGIYNRAFGMDNTSSPEIKNCKIHGNMASQGAGIYSEGIQQGTGSPYVLNCHFYDNQAEGGGGGIYTIGKDYGISRMKVVNCIVQSNVAGNGGAVFNYSTSGGQNNPNIINCTFSDNYAENDGGGLYNQNDGEGSSKAVLTNCILWTNRAGNSGNQIYNAGVSAVITYCAVEGGLDAMGSEGHSMITYRDNLEKDPRFVNEPNPENAPGKEGNLHLRVNSPCLDAGLNDSVSVNLDIEGNVRLQNLTVDMGAYEGAQAPSIVYVNNKKAYSGIGSSWESAYNNLSEALRENTSYVQIWVAQGIYRPSMTSDILDPESSDDSFMSDEYYAKQYFVISETQQVYGGFKGTETSLEERDIHANETILSGGTLGDYGDPLGPLPAFRSSYHVVVFVNAGKEAILDGFTIKGGVADCADTDQHCAKGAGIYNISLGPGNISSPTIRNCLIYSNDAQVGTGMYNGAEDHGVSNPVLMNCIFRANKAFMVGGGFYNYSANNGISNPILINCVFSGNASGYYGGAMYNFSKSEGRNNPRLMNCTFSGNKAGSKGGALYNRSQSDGQCSPILTNCIIWNNKADESGNQVYNRDASPVFTYCDIEGGSGAFGSEGAVNVTYHSNINADPLFVGITNPDHAPTTEGNLQLKTGSPCINAGFNDSVTVASDVEGQMRIQSTTVDMGSYEGGAAYEVIFVDAAAQGSNTGTSWEHAYTDLQDALDRASALSSIWIAKGIYHPKRIVDFDGSGEYNLREATFQIPDYVRVFGGFSGTENALEERDLKSNETILSGNIGDENSNSDNAYHVVYFDHVSDQTKLDGVTITEANAYSSGGGIRNDGSGWRQFSHPIISNCIIKSNYVKERGGGIYSTGAQGGNAAPKIINCKIKGNYSENSGGGVYTSAWQEGHVSPKLINCIISGNKADNRGGGMYMWLSEGSGNAELVNCTFSGNEAGDGGGIFTQMDTSTQMLIATNCIFWDNKARESGNQYYNHGEGQIDFGYCDMGGGREDIGGSVYNMTYENNLEADPLFVGAIDPENAPTPAGNLRLQEGSPCIDAGTNDPVKVPFDLDLNDRIQGSAVDMGAYESEDEGKIPEFIDAHESLGLMIYPNPTRGLLKIELSEDSKIEMLELINITGVTVDSRKVTGQILFLDLSSYPDGVYLVRAVGEKHISIARIVKH
ncbi:MAG: T9SS type A sorting domain-containing protein, partial [Bacteroidales bacterium]